MKAVVAAFNQEKALVGAFSVITTFGWTFLKHYWSRHLGCGVHWAQRAGLLLGGEKHVLLSTQVTGKPPLLLRSVQVEVKVVLIRGIDRRKCI